MDLPLFENWGVVSMLLNSGLGIKGVNRNGEAISKGRVQRKGLSVGEEDYGAG